MQKKKILILGGYGGNNVGDDAQLAGSLEVLKSEFPEYTFVVLTPNLMQTALRHNVEAVALASRNALFDFDISASTYVQWRLPKNKKWLLERYKTIEEKINCKTSEKLSLLTKRQRDFCENIRTSRLVFYVGGGYLMGPTASRLWDAALVAEIANLYNVPLVFSGHNIGIWKNSDNKRYAKTLFKNSPLITTRDRTFSKQDLSEIGIQGDHIYSTCDDALFLDTTHEAKKITLLLQKLGLKNEDFVALSFHNQDVIESSLKTLLKSIQKKILIIPTCPPDVEVQKEFCKIHNNERIIRIENLLTFRETSELFKRAFFTISTRHHPLIFTLSAGKPCISLNLTEYFSKKNFGALDLCNISEMSIDVDDHSSENVQLKLERCIKRLTNDMPIYKTLITESFYRIRDSKQRFISDLRKILDNSGNHLS